MYRIGYVKTGLFPWFEAPAAGAPVRYDGWLWDPAKREWVEDEVAEIELKVVPKAEPKPQRPPGPTRPHTVEGWEYSLALRKWCEMPMPMQKIPFTPKRPPVPTYYPAHPGVGEVPGWKFDFVGESWEPVDMPVEIIELPRPRPPAPKDPPAEVLTSFVPGWHWDRNTQQWIAIITPTEIIEFEPPRSFPPQVEYAQVNMVFPMTEQYVHFQQSLINMGLDPSEARRIANSMVDGFWNMSRSALTKHRAETYAQSFQFSAVALSDTLEKIGIYGAVIALAAILGALIGNILERLIMPHEQSIGLTPEVETFLLGPDFWCYGRHIGTSAKGRLYYSSCDDIGTEYSRHKRGVWGSKSDVIDFPGGFVEEGWSYGKFRKYTWTQWNIEYYGMLYSVGSGIYALKRAPLEVVAPFFPTYMLKEAEWCINFRYYL